MKTWRALGAITASACAAAAVVVACGGDDASSAGPADGSADGTVASGDGSEDGSLGDAALADGATPKPGRFLFAKPIPAAAGPAVALPGGGWAVLVEILHSTTIAGTVITRNGRDDAALVKLDANGDPVWAKPILGPGDDNRSDLAVDEAGNLYVAGVSIMGTSIDFGDGVTVSTPSPSNAQWAWYAKFDTSGTALWARSVGADSGLGSVGIAAHGGRVAVAGFYYELNLKYMTSGGVTTAPAFGNGNTFILSCGADDGYATSLARLAGASTGSGGVAIDSDTGRTLVAGSFNTPTLTRDPSGDVVTRVGTGQNAFAISLDASGTIAWARAFGSTAPDAGFGAGVSRVAADGTGHVVLGGVFYAPVDFGAGVRSGAGGGDPFALGVNPASGATLWDEEIGTSADDGFGFAAIVPGGDVATLGYLFDAAAPRSVDGIPLPTTVGPLVAKLAPAPKLAWTWHATVAPNARAYASSIAANGSGQYLVVGGIKGTVDLGDGPLEESDSGFEDMYVLGLADP